MSHYLRVKLTTKKNSSTRYILYLVDSVELEKLKKLDTLVECCCGQNKCFAFRVEGYTLNYTSNILLERPVDINQKKRFNSSNTITLEHLLSCVK